MRVSHLVFASDVHAHTNHSSAVSPCSYCSRGVPTKGGELGTPGSGGSVPSKYDREMGMDCTRCEAASSRDRRVVALPLGREVTANSV
mgnify:CR=1 FL=1